MSSRQGTERHNEEKWKLAGCMPLPALTCRSGRPDGAVITSKKYPSYCWVRTDPCEDAARAWKTASPCTKESGHSVFLASLVIEKVETFCCRQRWHCHIFRYCLVPVRRCVKGIFALKKTESDGLLSLCSDGHHPCDSAGRNLSLPSEMTV